MMVVFYVGVALFVATGVACLVSGSRFLRYALSGVSAALLLVSLASIVSFLSLYVYELPTHHCPFDMIQRGYSFIGYPIYLTLFAGVYFGLLPGLFAPLRTDPEPDRPDRRGRAQMADGGPGFHSRICLHRLLAGHFRFAYNEWILRIGRKPCGLPPMGRNAREPR